MSKVYHRGQGAEFTQLAIFKQIWALSNKRSFISGLHLRGLEGTELFLSCFAHVLAKGLNQYPHFKYYAKNVVLLHPEEHFLIDQGSEEQRINYELDKPGTSWKKLYDLRDELQREYKKNFPATRGLVIGYKYSPEEVVSIVGKLNKEFFESLIKD